MINNHFIKLHILYREQKVPLFFTIFSCTSIILKSFKNSSEIVCPWIVFPSRNFVRHACCQTRSESDPETVSLNRTAINLFYQDRIRPGYGIFVRIYRNFT